MHTLHLPSPKWRRLVTISKLINREIYSDVFRATYDVWTIYVDGDVKKKKKIAT